MQKIGFIGVGVMGKSMVRNLVKKGYDVEIYTRTKSKVEDLLKEGIVFKDNAGLCAQDKDVVITIVGYPSDVKEVYFGENGIIENAREGTILIDMTTSSPELAKEIYEASKKHHLESLDAPVSGGDSGAKAGTLAIMVGGDKETFDKAYPVFEAMGKNIVYQGPAGCGQHTKMANQIALAGAIAGVAEAIAYANGAGLDPKIMLDTISTGAAGSWQMTNNGPKMLVENNDPGFYIKHFIKDLRIAIEESENNDLHLDVLNDVLNMYETLSSEGLDELGTQALYKYYL